MVECLPSSNATRLRGRPAAQGSRRESKFIKLSNRGDFLVCGVSLDLKGRALLFPRLR